MSNPTIAQVPRKAIRRLELATMRGGLLLSSGWNVDSSDSASFIDHPESFWNMEEDTRLNPAKRNSVIAPAVKRKASIPYAGVSEADTGAEGALVAAGADTPGEAEGALALPARAFEMEIKIRNAARNCFMISPL